ncbi:undecaprenyl/decaprenyl-phosphate alpha-N-acetylglucosaminyl 1-phosphate transferase [Desulfovibrio sp. JY]|nr:undecaprenyl/decaprenyl-phosphate alpha-N-acetylglucosaminyl 1-phosphate transferase [Desulfovibrio sp. JY]
MAPILSLFLAALGLSLALTPLARWLGRRFRILAMPQARTVHTTPMPRSGGLALFLTFFGCLALAGTLLPPSVTDILFDRPMLFVYAGAVLIFAVGFADDKWTLPSKLKLVAQIVAACVACFGGARIASFAIPGHFTIHFELLSYAVTVFWFVLLINAINLIDGLDGLAAGVVFFASGVQAVLAIMRGEAHTAAMFAVMAGATLGFLRYNFNPASLFLGDGGSYFLGYMLAALSVSGSVKSQVGATLLMPLIALGVPLLDTITAPLRRFLRGRDMFEPDKRHVHHKLLSRGWSQRKVVLFIYAITIFLALTALVLVNLRNAPAGLFLLVVGAALVLLVRKAGFFSYFAVDKILGWLRDVSDDTGIARERRTFLNHQIEISQAPDIPSLWARITAALELLRFDMAEMVLSEHGTGTCRLLPTPPGSSPAADAAPDAAFRWRREGSEKSDRELLCSPAVMKLELPLLGKDGHTLGALWLVKDLGQDPINEFTLRRVENLRRTVTATLETLAAS